MCAQFMLKTSLPEIQHFFEQELTSLSGESWDLRARGFIKTDRAPVIVIENNQLVIKEMYLSLCPSWSKEFPARFTSYNARLERIKTDKAGKPMFGADHNPIVERIYEMPAWKESFKKKKFCLVPMNAAVESSYFGTHAGEIVQFHQPEDQVFLCLGIWNDWLDRNTGELKETFTLLTDHPYQFFVETGHDRSVLLIGQEKYQNWLSESRLTDEEQFKWIRENRVGAQWRVRSEKKMAEGWQKRAPTPLEVLELETFENLKLSN